MRLILVFLTATFLLYAEKHNHTILQMHARVLPSIVLMDRQIDQKAPEKLLKIAVLFEESDKLEAEGFASLLRALDQDKIAQYKIEPLLVRYGQVLPRDINAIYLLISTNEKIRASAKMATDQKIVSFSYQEDGVELGVMSSLSVGKQTVPYINLQTIQRSEIVFNPQLITMSKRFVE